MRRPSLKKACFLLLLVLALPPGARSETIYAVAVGPGDLPHFALLRFDSASPGVMQRIVPITGAIRGTEVSLGRPAASGPAGSLTEIR